MGTYCAAAELCSTTAKTVKRVRQRSASSVVAWRQDGCAIQGHAGADRRPLSASVGRIAAKRLLAIGRVPGNDRLSKRFRRVVATPRTRVASTREGADHGSRCRASIGWPTRQRRHVCSARLQASTWPGVGVGSFACRSVGPSRRALSASSTTTENRRNALVLQLAGNES